MRVMVFVKATDDSEKGFRPTAETKAAMEAMGKFNDALRDAGILVMADGLTPSSRGKRIAFDGPGRTLFGGVTTRPSLKRTHSRTFKNGNVFLRYEPGHQVQQ